MSTTATAPPEIDQTKDSVWGYYKNLLLARILRYLGPIGFLWHNFFLSPRAHRPSYTLWIDSITSEQHSGKGKIRLDVYLPRPASSRSRSRNVASSDPASGAGRSVSSPPEPARSAIINFHGGGFAIGSSRDDARFALYATSREYLNAIFISVEYRLAPEYPFPTPVEDCADAIRYVLDHAEELGVDKERVLLSGFSAGGNLAAAGWLLATKPETVGYPRFEAKGKGVDNSEGSSTGVSALSEQSSSTSARTRTSGMPDRKLDSDSVHGEVAIRGIIAFYPLLDWASPQSYKLSHHPSPDTLRPLPPWLVNLFDTSYLPRSNPVDRHNPLISPGIAPDELLRDFPPIHQVLCERDLLLAEGQIFHERLVKMGKTSTVRIVKGEKHGWDKPPNLVKPSVHEEYDEAFRVAKTWLEE